MTTYFDKKRANKIKNFLKQTNVRPKQFVEFCEHILHMHIFIGFQTNEFLQITFGWFFESMKL